MGEPGSSVKMTYFVNFFPHFVRQRMASDLITFNFHQEGQSTREYIDQVFTTAEFLKYDADEQQLVDRIIMNLYPSVLAQAAFLERPVHARTCIVQSG